MGTLACYTPPDTYLASGEVPAPKVVGAVPPVLLRDHAEPHCPVVLAPALSVYDGRRCKAPEHHRPGEEQWAEEQGEPAGGGAALPALVLPEAVSGMLPAVASRAVARVMRIRPRRPPFGVEEESPRGGVQFPAQGRGGRGREGYTAAHGDARGQEGTEGDGCCRRGDVARCCGGCGGGGGRGLMEAEAMVGSRIKGALRGREWRSGGSVHWCCCCPAGFAVGRQTGEQPRRWRRSLSK